jgi:DNA-binding LacI/PurR family transcriptional regulator
VGDFTAPSGRDLTFGLFRAHPDTDGLFVAGELMAHGSFAALHRLGRRIPDDVAVVSLDDLPAAAFADPPLTSRESSRRTPLQS